MSKLFLKLFQTYREGSRTVDIPSKFVLALSWQMHPVAQVQRKSPQMQCLCSQAAEQADVADIPPDAMPPMLTDHGHLCEVTATGVHAVVLPRLTCPP